MATQTRVISPSRLANLFTLGPPDRKIRFPSFLPPLIFSFSPNPPPHLQAPLSLLLPHPPGLSHVFFFPVLSGSPKTSTKAADSGCL